MTSPAFCRDFGPPCVERRGLFEVTTCARTKRISPAPGLGPAPGRARTEIVNRCPAGAGLQVVIGDGLSVAAVVRHVPPLLDPLAQGARERGWRFGQPFVIRHCRVGVLNEVGGKWRFKERKVTRDTPPTA